MRLDWGKVILINGLRNYSEHPFPSILIPFKVFFRFPDVII